MKRNHWREGKKCGREHRPNWNRRHQHRSFHERHNTGEHQDTTSAETINAEGASSGNASHPAAAVPELPGFYYDPEKNRYFRLLPGHNNCNPLTKERIQHKEMESRRLRLLEEEKQGRKPTRTGLHNTLLLQKRQLGLVPSVTYCRRVHELRVSCMQRKKVAIQNQEPAGAEMHNFNLILADSACERIFTVNDVENGYSKYGVIYLNGLWKDRPTVGMYDQLHSTNCKVKAACWASLTGPDSHVLVCFMGMAETPGCVSLLPASLFGNTNPGEQPGMLCSLRISNAWSCAWCSNPGLKNSFATGLRRQVLVTNTVTGVRETFKTNSDILAQQFATQTLLLYNGCRSGEVFSIDLRVPATTVNTWKKGVGFYHNSAVTSLRLLQDENYLMVTDMAGEIKLWDMRTVKCVKRYEGNHNQYAHLPLHVNEEEGLLLAVGQDCYTRIWSLQDSRLLRTIPSPHPTAKDSIPSVIFSSRLGGKQGIPGLLMAVKQDLFHFSYDLSI
ncbi:DDB1- and CUL4-associated factor 4 isoform X1 [Ascaphus truei]|uniref:DDB1- and CUL4-associated factor 4 isoform X1 n=1 Tax=Ascaphus truei TaxID=8439 RepID=UPI003F590468